MALLTRLANLFRADFNAVLDHIEEPELLLKQAVRDMEHSLALTEGDVHQTEVDLQGCQKKLINVQQKITDLDDELSICLEEEKDVLARNLIRQKLELQQYADYLANTLASHDQQLKSLTSGLAENRSVLEGFRQKLDLLPTRQPEQSASCAGSRNACWTTHGGISDSDIDIALLKEKKKRAVV